MNCFIYLNTIRLITSMNRMKVPMYNKLSVKIILFIKADKY